MGILGYPNMDDGNHDGAFGDYSDIYSNFSEEENTLAGSGEETFGDTASAGNSAVNETYAANQQNKPQEDTASTDFQNYSPAKQNDSSRLTIYLIVLGLVLVAAVGLFFYKKNMSSQDVVSSEQAMGDYFYDKAEQNVSAQAPQADAQATETQGQQQNLATVDVDLTANTAAVPSAATQNDKAQAVKKDGADKPLTALEKAMAKKKADEQKDKLSFGGNSVVIPVSAGGRPDPFLPYGVQSPAASKPQFDLVAPPMDVPEADPMTEKIFNFKLTGIMYDNVRPSAILSIDDTEQLVHKGDIVAGYKILDIKKKSVVVKYNSNTYEICAGQNLETGVNLNPVSVSNQFGGAYSQSSNVIQFNN